ncbi:MAG: hypothetical protein ACJ786_25130 [Catenulispora sp.]
MSTTKGGWSYSASVPADTTIAAAITAFQNYSAVLYDMSVKVEHDNNLVNYADGNVLSLAQNYVTQERQLFLIRKGPETIKVLSATPDAAKPPVVTITACVDDTKYNTYITSGPKNGQLAGQPQTTAHPNIYKVHQGADGKWRVNAVTPQRDKSC